MKLVVGLGNPGKKYQNNRHNVGYLVVDKLVAKIRNKSKILVFKSQNFMNESGDFIKKLVDQYRLNTPGLWIIHDDLDIKLGEYKIQFSKGPKVHNGVISIEDSLGTKDFWRVRVGVDNRTGVVRNSGEKYVLEDFEDSERQLLENTIKVLTQDLVARLSLVDNG